jgi:hypothetical protein
MMSATRPEAFLGAGQSICGGKLEDARGSSLSCADISQWYLFKRWYSQPRRLGLNGWMRCICIVHCLTDRIHYSAQSSPTSNMTFESLVIARETIAGATEELQKPAKCPM